MKEKLINRIKQLDKWILIPYLGLTLFSIVIVYSASSYSSMADYGHPNNYLTKQLVFVAISVVAAAAVYLFPFRVLKSKTMIKIGTVIIFGLLFIVLFMPEVQGASRWIPLPFFNIQPSEFAKVFVIWYLAYIFSRKQDGLQENFWPTAGKPSILMGVIVFFIIMQPDTGTAIIIVLMVVMMLSASGASLNYGLGFFAMGTLFIALALFLVYNYGENLPGLGYRYDRFLGLWDPFGYAESHGHQLVNSYYALNRGGFFGVGIGNSIQKTGYLPFPYTDFIIAIIGEELGLVGVTVVLGALGTIIGRSFYLGSQAQDTFNGLISIGVGAMLLVQSLINLAGVTGLIPISGITFPFLSYGGSSLLVVSISTALVANASALDRRQKNK